MRDDVGPGAPEEVMTARVVRPSHPPRKPTFREALLEGWQVNVGWILTGLSLYLAKIPFQLVLKEEVHLSQTQIATFMLVASIPIYIKPLAGIMVDAVPFFGTRRRHYLLWGLLLGSIAWVVLALVPRTYDWLCWTYFVVAIFLTLNSTVFGGLMVEIGKEKHITGKLSAQRHGITRFLEAITGPWSGILAKGPFVITMWCTAVLQLLMWPVVYFGLREKRGARLDTGPLREVKRQAIVLVRAKNLWAAAGLIVLVVAAPGFETPKLFFQRNELGFDPVFIGWLEVYKSAAALAAAIIYGLICKRYNLRTILGASIVLHAILTLAYLGYRNEASAIIVESIESATMVLALLPLYDLSARATPRGSEALGYSVMMSVWNFTQKGSDWVGSYLVDKLHFSFFQLVYVNAATTLLVLVAVPFLPAALMNRRDGEAEHGSAH
jgi:Na+/melibiose symporter-like transporter